MYQNIRYVKLTKITHKKILFNDKNHTLKKDTTLTLTDSYKLFRFRK